MQCVTLWIGDSLGPVERACLRSALRQGHDVAMYCYDPVSGVPEGIELRDADPVIPRRSVFRNRDGGVAFFSDWFRYELQARGSGTWIDTDVYLIRALDEERPYLFGEQEPGVINNAILRLPAQSPALTELLEIFHGKTPRWLRPRAHLAARIRELVTGHADVAQMPWGTTGPAALTAVAEEQGLRGHAFPPQAFYPVAWQQADWILDPHMSLDDVTKPDTVAVHLWNERIKPFKNRPAPVGSVLERLHQEGR